MLMCANTGACAWKYSEDNSTTYTNFMPNEHQMGLKNETLIKTDCNQTVATVEYHSLSTDKSTNVSYDYHSRITPSNCNAEDTKYGSSRNASDESIESERMLNHKDYEEEEKWGPILNGIDTT